jgi:hypothetical protein
MSHDHITPEQASHGRTIPDRDLPMVAAQWLVDGHDSPLLRELASLTSRQALEGQVRLADVLAELGHPARQVDSPYEQLAWRGRWEDIWWAVDRLDRTHRPYASAQYVLEIIGDYEGLWEPGGGDALMALLRDWDEKPDERAGVEARIRSHLRGLREDDVPPLLAQSGQD